MLTIGTFSRLGHISVRMLRHYDAIGLLHPAYTDTQTGYRYYEGRQLETLGRIALLKHYRFTLSEITGLLALDAGALREAMHAKRLALYAEAASLDETLRRMDRHIENMEAMNMDHQAYQVTVMEEVPQRIFGIRRTIHIGQVHALFQDVRGAMEERGLTQAGAALFYFLGEEFNYERMDVEAAFPVAQAHPDTRMTPGGPHVATMHIGPYDAVRGAYEAIAAFLDAHPEWDVCGPGVERYIRDETDGAAPQAYETGVLFPVKRVEK